MNYRHVQSRIEDEWSGLAAFFLPHEPSGSIWRYGRVPMDKGLAQGWKLHISATVLNASSVLNAVAPILEYRRIPFKAPRSINELMKINAGIYYGYSQVGKFITVYPVDQSTVSDLAQNLHEATKQFTTPRVPFDNPFISDGSVYYRYGSFRNEFVEGASGNKLPAMRSESGELIPDLRNRTNDPPDGTLNPFPAISPTACGPNPLNSKFRIFEALSQRGKGGVYKAYEFANDTPKICVVKEGRKSGEVHWDGRDGAWRVRHERLVLSKLRLIGVDVPSVINTFELDGNVYLVTEFICGQTLREILVDGSISIAPVELLRLTSQLASILSRIHKAGWVWRDCKPANLILTEDQRLRPVDFEGACRIGDIDALPWSTPMYSPPEVLLGKSTTVLPSDDLFALGTIIRQILDRTDTSKKLRTTIKTISNELCNGEPTLRPTAESIGIRLSEITDSFRRKRRRSDRQNTIQF